MAAMGNENVFHWREHLFFIAKKRIYCSCHATWLLCKTFITWLHYELSLIRYFQHFLFQSRADPWTFMDLEDLSGNSTP